MEYLIVVLVVLAVWHYLYESIILPAIHTSLRNKFFALRDELRQVVIDDNSVDEAAFEIAHVGVNTAINSVDALDLAMYAKLTHRFNNDAAFRERVEARVRVIEDTKSHQIRSIVKRANENLRDVWFYNAGGWLIYIVPIAFAILLGKSIMKSSKELLSLTETDAARIFQVHQAA